MASIFRYRRTAWFAMLIALIVGMIPLSAGASSHHTATRTEVTFTSTVVEVLNEGEEWVDDAGILHFRGFEQLEELSGDISGAVIINFNGDFQPVGECTDESCPAYFSVWGRIEVQGEDGGWVGTYVSFGSDVPGEEFAADSLVLRGTGANAHKSIVAQSASEDEASITFEGVMSTLATPMVGINTNVRLCADEDFSFGGGFLSTGAVEGHGGATGDFLVGGGPWTHTYAVAGTVTLTDEHGTVTIGFGGGAQDVANPNVFTSHVFGHFMILDGTGEYAEIYGGGRLIAAAIEGSPACESGFGVNLTMIGEAHYN